VWTLDIVDYLILFNIQDVYCFPVLLIDLCYFSSLMVKTTIFIVFLSVTRVMYMIRGWFIV